MSARWSGCCSGEEGGDGEGTLAVVGLGGGDDDDEQPPPARKKEQRRKKKLPPLQKLRLAGMTSDEAADLCLEIRSRVAAAAAATRGGGGSGLS